jgi:hypothetical protein
MSCLPSSTSSCKPCKVVIRAEQFGGRVTSHLIVVGRAPGESCLAVQHRAAAEYRRKFGLSSRIVSFEINVGG